ncbi:MAG: P-II family nitrogen regulator [Elusimicrobiaceae bacterium]
MEENAPKAEPKYVLIKIVAQRRMGNRVMRVALKNGAPGITYYYARGTGVREKLGFLANLIEAEKVIIEIVEEESRAAALLDTIVNETKINEPGKGFCYISPVTKVAGFYRGE